MSENTSNLEIEPNQSINALLRELIQKHQFWKITATTLLGISVVGGIALSFHNATSTPQLEATPTVTLDPEWLSNPNWLSESDCDELGKHCRDRHIQDSYEQMRLWLSNTDLTRGQLGIIPQAENDEAHRYRSAAFGFIQNPKHPCSKLGLTNCLATFANNVKAKIAKAKTPGQLAAFLAQYRALQDARMGSLQPPGQPNQALAQRIIERWEEDLKLAIGNTADGLSQAATEAERLEKEAIQDAERGFSLEGEQPK